MKITRAVMIVSFFISLSPNCLCLTLERALFHGIQSKYVEKIFYEEWQLKNKDWFRLFRMYSGKLAPNCFQNM